jgi:hypothetical protein
MLHVRGMAGSLKGAMQQPLSHHLSPESAYQREEFSDQKANGANNQTDERRYKVQHAE